MTTTIERPPAALRPRGRANNPTEPTRLEPARRRKVRVPELLAGLVLVGLCGIAAVVWRSSSDARRPVAVLRASVPKGAVVTEADLRPAEVALGDGVRAVAWEHRAALVGKTALTDLPADTVLVSALVADQPALGAGEALVGLKLEPGAYPAGDLRAGDAVEVVGAVTATAAAGAAAGADAVPPAAPLAASATVWSITDLADKEATVLVTLRLPEGDAARVSAVADQVRVVRVVR